MTQDARTYEGQQYWAFISYSHKDAAFGRRLHNRLEGYALPRRLVGRATPRGTVPKRLAPIFRDREEFSAAHDLSTEVQAALKASRTLIVVCSPSAKVSPWVAREIELFRKLHPERPVLAAIREGEPADCFPSKLLQDGADGAAIEPLAADFRRGRDGDALGLLKLVAGIVGIGLDEIVQRDAHRRTQRVTAITAGAVLVALFTSLSAFFAVNARNEAEHQRGAAEGLVEYMLTDLRDRLKGVGRLDVMTAVNERALKYYGDQDISKLPVDSLERRARILHAMGEDDETRGDHEAALAKFREAARMTSALLAQNPNDPERIFDQAQSVFWIGYVDFQRGRDSVAKPAFLNYAALADRMVAIAPHKLKYRMEVGYAESTLCSLESRAKPIDAKAVIGRCTAALDDARETARDPSVVSDHERRETADALMNRYANLADAYLLVGDSVHAMAARKDEERFLNREIARDPQNSDLADTLIALQIALARLEQSVRDEDSARTRLNKARALAQTLVLRDPSNQRWRDQLKFIDQELAQNATPLRQRQQGDHASTSYN